MKSSFLAGTALVLSLSLLAACNNDTTTTTETTTDGAVTTSETTTTTVDSTSAADSTGSMAATDGTAAPGSNTEAISAVQDAVAGATGVISAEMTTTTKGFAEAAAISDMYEIEASKIAATRATSPELKKFASEMVAAHTKTSAGLKAKLKEAKSDVVLPTSLDSRRQGMIENLKGAAPEDFDTRYTNQQVNAHQEAVILFRGYSESGDNPVLKAAAAETLPKIEEHLNHVKMLDKSDVDQKSMPNAAGTAHP